MNNTLNINRFGKILKHDGLNFFPNLILTLAILWAIPVIVYLAVALMPTNDTKDAVDAFSRVDLISTLEVPQHAYILRHRHTYRICSRSTRHRQHPRPLPRTIRRLRSVGLFRHIRKDQCCFSKGRHYVG